MPRARYAESVQSAQRFLSIHPGNNDAPYASCLVALCCYEQISDVTRDQKITQQALTALTEVARRYPATTYATDARLKLDLVNDHLARARTWKMAASTSAAADGWPARFGFRTVIEEVSARRAVRARGAVWLASRAISCSVLPNRRRSPPPCWAPTTPAASGTNVPAS